MLTAGNQVFVAREALAGSTGSLQASVICVDVQAQTARYIDESGVASATVQPRTVCWLDKNPFDVCVDRYGNVYISSIDSAAVMRVSHGTTIAETYAGVNENSTRHIEDGEASTCRFAGTAGIAAFPCGTTVFAIDWGESSITKISSMKGFAKWARAHRTLFEVFGFPDPTRKNDEAYMARVHLSWADSLPTLHQVGQVLEGIEQRRLSDIGREFGQGPELMMDCNSTRAFTRKTIPNMQAIYDRINAIEASVAAALDTKSSSELEAELMWSGIRLHALDSSFGMFMYVVTEPKVAAESLKRMLDCSFNYETTDRKVGKESYSYRREGKPGVQWVEFA